jgi:23S rRNA pseudouridine955/2504/2580 synthase
MRENKIDKRYQAVGHGDWLAGWGRRRIVKEPLHKFLTPEGERRVRVQDDGLASHTVLNLIERFDEYAWVEVELKTGRTHQIRVHMAHIGMPIAGDTKYGDFALNKALARGDANPSLKRMFLHAFRLKLVHPATGETLQVEAPLPVECRGFIEQLKNPSRETL